MPCGTKSRSHGVPPGSLRAGWDTSVPSRRTRQFLIGSGSGGEAKSSGFRAAAQNPEHFAAHIREPDAPVL